MNNNLPTIQNTVKNPSVVARIEARLGEKAGTFITSLLDVCGEDKTLQSCNPNDVIKEAFKAAALDLPINKNLGFAYVIPYKGVPQFQMGYKGYIQLCIRTGLYKHINADSVYEGETIVEDRIAGTFTIEGSKESDKVIGYFAYFELLNGFQKGIAWTKEKVTAHAKKYSKSFSSKYSPWQTSPDSMGKKTVLMQLLPKFGIMNIEMSQAMKDDRADFKGFNSPIDSDPDPETIDIPTEPGGMSEADKQAALLEEQNPEY